MKLCEVCLNNLEGPKIDLGFHPLCDDLGNNPSSSYAEKFHQEIQLCKVCLTAHQLHQVPKEKLFKPSYHYRSNLTKDVLLGMESLVLDTLNSHPKKSDLVVIDVGCNDGSLLGKFKKNVACVTIGIDPTDAIVENTGSIDFPYQAFFDIELANLIKLEHGIPDIITFTNVFAHIENLPSLLDALRVLVGPETVVVIENHYLGSILDRSQFDTFYHEHPRTYSARSFDHIARNLELSINTIKFPSRYGGNIRVSMSNLSDVPDESLVQILADEIGFLESFGDLQQTFDTWKTAALESWSALTRVGPVYGKSLPGRAVMLISSLEITASTMPKIFEQPTSPKVGFYVPATDIEIASDAELVSSSGGRLIIWSWHIVDEICEYLSDIGFKGEIWVPLPRFEKYKTI